MSKKPLNISEEAAVQMPMKTVASLIIIVALGTMGYFQILERLNIAATTGTITIFFFTHSNLVNLILVLAAICIFKFSVLIF